MLLEFSLFSAVFMPVCSAECQGHSVILKTVALKKSAILG